MKLRTAAATLAGLAFSAMQPAAAQHWGYSGEASPQNWGKLDPKFSMCAIGKKQSPIDLSTFTKSDLKPVKLDYKRGTTEILNNGHTVQINYMPGSSLTVDGRTFELKQFHFHSPSENTVNGKHFPLEGHLVHADKDGNLAVVAVMFSEGPANPFLASLWQRMPTKTGDKSLLAEPLTASDMLPAKAEYYRFEGSLTTPPCSEGVRWMVVKKSVTASKAQIDAFSKAVGFANNRPVQPLNARQVLTQ